MSSAIKTAYLAPLAALGLGVTLQATAAAPPAGWDPAADVTPGPSTMQPFAPGDVFVAATVMNDPKDDHAGIDEDGTDG